MLSKKLWHSFFMIFSYLLVAAGIAAAFSLLCKSWTERWWGLLIIGAVLWLLSAVLAVFAIKSPERTFLSIPALAVNAVGLGIFIATYAVGKSIVLSPLFFFALAVITALTYLLLMALFSIPTLKEYLWYTIVAYLVWLAGVICLGIFVFPYVITWLGIPLPEEFGAFVFFYLLTVGFLAIGSLLPADDFWGVTLELALPALVASFIVFIVVLLCLLGGDGCDCDGCDCCDGGDCSGGRYDPTEYERRSRYSRMMSDLANP